MHCANQPYQCTCEKCVDNADDTVVFKCDEAACKKDSRFYEAFEMDDRWEIIRAILASAALALPPDDPQMTPKQYADAIDRLGLSQRAAGAFLGVDERQSRRWVAGDSAIPESVAKLLRLMIKLGLKPQDL